MNASDNIIKLNWSEDQITISSQILLKWIDVIEETDKNSITKSLSETASIELWDLDKKFNSFVVKFLSIGKEVPANAAAYF